MTELFKLITIEKRNKLFFNKFKYRATLKLAGVGYTYYTYDIDSYINRIERFKEQDTKWPEWSGFGSFANIKYNDIEKYFIFRDTMDRNLITSRIDGNTVSFFSNDTTLFDPLYYIDAQLKITEAKVLNPGTLYLKRTPKHKFRTYFKSRRMPAEFPENVINFMNSYKSANVCAGLKRFIYSRSNWTNFVYLHGSYFVDYDDEGMITILHMLFGNMIGKTYSLAKEPKN